MLLPGLDPELELELEQRQAFGPLELAPLPLEELALALSLVNNRQAGTRMSGQPHGLPSISRP